MTGKAIVGRGVASTPGAGSGGATWRGILLIKDEFDSWQTLGAGSATVAVEFDAVPFDSDNFVSAGSNVIGGVTVPAGSAAVIPVGLAGLYRVTSSMATVINAAASGYQFNTILAKNDQEDSYPVLLASDVTGGWTGPAVVPPGLFRCAEGDVIWQLADNDSASASVLVISRSWLLVEYLIPWALDET